MHNINLDYHPTEWFNIFFPKSHTKNTRPKTVTIEELQSWTNTKEMMANADRRRGNYKGFEDFTKKEMMACLGVYLLHGIPPALQIYMKLNQYQDDPVNRSNLCN